MMKPHLNQPLLSRSFNTISEQENSDTWSRNRDDLKIWCRIFERALMFEKKRFRCFITEILRMGNYPLIRFAQTGVKYL